MGRASLSLMGLYQYHSNILDDLVLPVALEGDRETIKENLLMDTAELEVIYPDPDFLQAAIGSWSRKQVHVWTEMYETTQYDYNPIWNKDGTYTEKRTGNSKTDGSSSGSAEANHSVYGFNSSTEAPASKDTTATSQSGSSTVDTEENVEHTEQGNIGVTSTQQLIREQRDVVLFNIIDFIIEDFKKRFCLLIY